jgi:hypothetical protein
VSARTIDRAHPVMLREGEADERRTTWGDFFDANADAIDSGHLDISDITKGLLKRRGCKYFGGGGASAKWTIRLLVGEATAFTMVIGRRRYAVASLTEASSKFCAARDKVGAGASQTPTPMLYAADGKLVGYISYNGRVWAGHPRDWKPGAKLLAWTAE